MYGLYPGTVQAYYPVGHALNRSKYQPEYSVMVTVDNNAQTPINHCYMKDSNGILDDFEDQILSSGAQVWVMCPRGNYSTGIIVGCNRQYKSPVDPALGKHWRKRYNKIEQMIDQKGNWSVKSDSGPFMQVNTISIVIDDSAGQNAKFDKVNKILTINANKLAINVVGDADLTVGGNLTAKVTGNASLTADGDASIKCANLNAEASGNANLKCANLSAKVSGPAKVDATGEVTVKGSIVSVNGKLGAVLTDQTMPVVDFITMVPSVGVPTFKAGGGG